MKTRCSFCGMEFEARDRRGKLCSDSCRLQSRRQYRSPMALGHDWGGRYSVNPAGCKRITKKRLVQLAHKLGYELRRGTYPGMPKVKGLLRSMWYGKKLGEKWENCRSFGITNYLAWVELKGLETVQ